MLPETAARSGSVRRSGWLALALCGLLAAGLQSWPVAAAVESYAVRVPVLDQGIRERQRAVGEALRRAFVRLSGDEDVVARPAVAAAVSAPGRFILSEGYERHVGPAPLPAAGSEEPTPRMPWQLVLGLDREALVGVLASAGAQVWSGRRPEVLAWVALEDADGKRLLGADDVDPLVAALREQAELRGLPLILPLLDLADLSRLSPRDLWAGFDDAVDSASVRYGADGTVVLRVYQDALGRWLADWRGEAADVAFDGAVELQAPEQAGAALVDALVDGLAGRYALRLVPGGGMATLWLQVDAVDALAAYGAMMRYLGERPGVSDVQLVQVSGSSMLLRVDASSLGDRLLDGIRLEGRLLVADEPEMAGSVPVWRARWRG